MDTFTLDTKIKTIIENCIKNRSLVLLSSASLPIAFQTTIKELDHSKIVLKNMVKPEFIRSFLNSSQFTLQAQMMRFQTNSIPSGGDKLIFPLLANSVIEETRQAERYSFSSSEKVVAEMINPFDKVTKLVKHIMDMSATGISIRSTIQSSLFFPGLEIPNIKVTIDGTVYSQNSGSVIYNRKVLDYHGQLHAQVGIKFTV